MFQREVAERIVAPPGAKTYGRLSVLAQWRTRGEHPVRHRAARLHAAAQGHLVAGRSSSRARRRCHATRRALERVTDAAFGQRRKMLRQSLKSLGADPLALLAAADIDPTARAEEISVDGFVRLARALVSLSPLAGSGRA